MMADTSGVLKAADPSGGTIEVRIENGRVYVSGASKIFASYPFMISPGRMRPAPAPFACEGIARDLGVAIVFGSELHIVPGVDNCVSDDFARAFKGPMMSVEPIPNKDGQTVFRVAKIYEDGTEFSLGTVEAMKRG